MMAEIVYIRGRPSYLGRAIAVSVILHVLLCAALLSSKYPEKEPSPISVTYVELAPPIRQSPPIERQIVSPVDKTLETPPVNPAFLSEKDSTAEKEQIKRGDSPDAAPVVSKNVSKMPLAKPERATKQSVPKEERPAAESKTERKTRPLTQLSLDAKTLQEKFSFKAEATPPPGSTSRAVNIGGYRPFSRPAGSGASIFGVRGSNDYLPNLPDGDVTLLNAKAEKYAVFVRRVATQVFTNLRSSGWEVLSSTDIRTINNFTTVTAVLSPSGQLLSISLETSSGSQYFDKVLNGAVRQGAKDPNPPPGALASDGKIHFIFKARSWNDTAVNGRTGSPFERRWLLLATGLE